MKKKLLSLILLCTLQPVFSQVNFNFAGHNGIDEAGGMVSINAKNYYIKTVEVGCCWRKVFVIGVGADGQTTFSTDVSITYDHLNKITTTADKCILVYGTSTPACDIGGRTDFIVKLDTNGTVLFKKNISFSLPPSYNTIVDISANKDSTIFISSDSLIINYDKDGLLPNTFGTDLNRINTVFSLPNGNLLLNGKINNVLTNIEYDPINSITVSQQVANYQIIKFLKTSSGKIIGLSASGELVGYSQAMVFSNTASGLTSSNLKVNDFCVRNDSVFVTGVNTQSHCPFYAVFSDGLTNLYLTQSTYKFVNPTGISINNKNRINIMSNGASTGNTPISFTGLFQMSISGVFHSAQDIGVMSFQATSAVMQAGTNGYYTPVVDLSVVVKNFGTDTVKHFYLNHYGGTLQLCNNLYHKLFDVVIPPGGMATVQSGTFSARPFVFQPVNHNGFSSLQLCPFTTVPDFKNDINVDNDATCDTIQFLITGIKENHLADIVVSLFPNPFNTSIQLKSDIEITRIELISAMGEKISEQYITAKEQELSYDNLTPGIYFLKIETEKGTAIKKIVKQ